MSAYRSLSRNLLKFDLRDWSTLIFTFIFPAALLIILVLTLGDAYDGMNLTGPISANVIAFGAAFVGIYAGATHLALWRENGMFNVLRNFPLSSNTVLGAQATAGTVLLLVQALLLFVIAIVMGTRPVATAPLALVPVILGYLLFFFLGVLLGIVVPSMAGVSMAATVIIIPLGMIGGAMMPMELMPDWVQTIGPFTPVYHMREAISMTLIGEGTWHDAGIGLGYLIGVGAVCGLLAQRTMRFK
ncbi:ABC transporter permease [Ancrocorticia populi]|uniref:Transport permease protein n=2 Tax=Ancrocorticia populi TaxID=2175228 RepID=A0A2V1KCC1_9ACTO|nr:ABC transporter permease [Ancrocorticia populi]MDN6487029.1 ABC transporter permease [Ancrocorticia sp.]PWF27341.1 ABC transporter permease [Ancrocorticia populi]